MRYVGSTINKFRLWWDNYKENNRKAKIGDAYMEPFIFEGFSSNDHNGLLEDCDITFTDKTDGADPLEQKNTGEL